jgi:His/Glu/Gln/Arg/opine family amino acid ABC transporter permease subunit
VHASDRPRHRLFLALAKQTEVRSLRTAANIYTTIFRGLPELLTIFMIYFGLQIAVREVAIALGFERGFDINSFFAGTIALSLVFSAYASEVLSSAFKAIPKGQYEAGHALGLRPGKTMRLIILPQLVRIALPGLGNLWMILLKDTALISVIGLTDILRQTGIAAKVTKEAFLFYGIACLLFLALAMAVLHRVLQDRDPRAPLGGEPMSVAKDSDPATAGARPRPETAGPATSLGAPCLASGFTAGIGLGALADRCLGHRQGRDLRPEIPFRPRAPR